MRLKEYINEADISVERMMELIVNNCWPYINDLRRQSISSPTLKHLLWSGRKNENKSLIKRKVKGRRPLDTPKEIHNMLDQMFKKQFGVEARSNSVFCYNSDFKVQVYGEPYSIFPMGKYKILWSPYVSDLYDTLNKINRDYMRWLADEKSEKMLKIRWNDLPPEEQAKYGDNFEQYKEYIKNYKEELKEEVQKYIDTYEVIDGRDLDKPQNHNELMVVCDSYLGVQGKYVDNVMKALNNEYYI